MKKVPIYNLVIEVTRKCNMTCEHCLRGPARNKNICLKHIDTLLDQVDWISIITFTGGEPSMNTPAIQYVLDGCKSRGIYVDSFYIVTNGKDITEEFVITCLKWYNYCESKDMCSLQLSNDFYHSWDEPELLKGLSFFSKRFEDDDRYDLINEGMANENGIGKRTLEEDDIIDTEQFQERNIYLNCSGKIINGCDWSYENQNDHKLCDVKDLQKFYNNLKKDLTYS